MKAELLEQYSNVPIVDQAGFINTFDMNLSRQLTT